MLPCLQKPQTKSKHIPALEALDPTRIEAALELEVDHRETMRIEGGLGEVMMPVAVAEAIHMAPDLVVEVAEVIPLVILDRGIHL